MVLTSWDGETKTGLALGAQSTNTGLKDGVEINGKGSYWQSPALILRPKSDTYVPELDLTGGPGTGIGSPRVAAAVNLLKTEGPMEGYRPGIYTDSGGVPTVGNGFALLVNGSKGWTVRSESEIKGLLRLAGLPESKYDELPIDTLKQAAGELQSGNVSAAKALFGDGKNPSADEFSVSPSQADRLTGAFIVADTTPKLVSGLGGPTAYANLTDGEFAAVAGSTYQNPQWLKTHPEFVKAWTNGDDDAAQAAFGTSKRGQAEANAYAGSVSTINEHLGAGTSTGTGGAIPLKGHWEDTNQYDAHGNVTVPGERVFIPDASASTSKPTTAGTSSTAAPSAESHTPYVPHTTTTSNADGTTTSTGIAIGNSGDGLIAKGDTVSAVRDADGKTLSEVIVHKTASGTAVTERIFDPNGGPPTETSTETDKNGNVVHQMTTHDGQVLGDSYITSGVTYTRTPDANGHVNWLDPNGNTQTERAVQGITDSDAHINQHATLPTTELTASVEHTGGTIPAIDAATAQIIDALSNPPVTPGGGVQLADAGTGTISDAGPGITVPSGDASTRNASTSNTPPALADTAQSAPETIANTDNSATPTPTSTPTPASTFAIFQTPGSDAALQPVGDGVGVVNSLTAVAHWGSQTDLGHLNSLVNLYNTVDHLGGGNNLPGELGQFGGYLGLAQSLQNHDGLGVVSSINSIGNGVVDNAVNSALGTSGVPYVGTLMALNNFDKHPGQSIGAIVGSFWGPVGSMIGSFVGGMLDNLFGSHSPPPPPDGVVHYTWDDNGAIAIHTDQNVSGGGDAAHGTASGILGMLQSVVDHQNKQNHAQGQDGGANTANTANDLALDPTRLPKVGFTAGMSWIEVTHADGTTTRETINPGQLGERILQVAVANDAVVPAWQVQTMQAHHQAQQQAQQQEARLAVQPSAQEVASATTSPDIDGHALGAISNDEGATTGHGPDASAQGIKGQASESADHKSQTYDALVVHLGNPAAQAHIGAIAAAHEANAAPSEVLRDIDGDGYFESTQWVDALDAQGNAQGMLVLDANRNGTIETADILHLGGNAAERNSMAWLDSNGDGKLDASDPAFAAIRLWVDCNHNGRMDEGESTGLQSIELTSIDLQQGTLTYADGQSDRLTTTTLTADTEGVKLDSVKIVGADGKLHELDAGALIVHEHYDGKTRTHGYELQAKVTGDWEKTDQAAQHRHGGGNVAGAPTETRATGASSAGPVLGKTNVVTATTLDAGDSRITSDAPVKASANNSTTTKPTTITLHAGDARIVSNPPQPKPVVFVPAGAREGWITEDGKALLQLPQDGLFNAGGLAALGVVTLGAVQQTAFAHTEPGDGGFTWQANATGLSANAAPSTASGFTRSEDATPTSATPTSGTTIHLEDFAVVRQIHLGVMAHTAQPLPGAHPTYPGESATPWPYRHPANGSEPGTPRAYLHPANRFAPGTPQPYPHPSESAPSTPSTLYITPRAPQPTVDEPTSPPAMQDNDTPPPSSATPPPTATDPAPPGNTFTLPPATTSTNPAVNATASDDRLSDPQEDTVLRVSVATLLANDTNATGIAQVGNAEHGTVSLQGSEVIFTPEANYHGPASFVYVVTGQDGGHAVGVASFNIEAVNDVPVAQGETVAANEDSALTITQATLLANDTDVDTATDGQSLRVSAVGHASHGTVNLLANGNGGGSIIFTPDANFHGTASFEYVVNDGNGGTATATATVQVAGVNDVPVALGETITSSEDTTLLVSQAALLANDTDADVATDGQVLTISAVSNATHGTVSILGNGQIQFVPVANFNGTATFDYVVSDGHGGTATATATVLVGSTDDAPVAAGETVSSQEDQTVTLTAAALLANDTDVDNATSELRISRVAAGTGGTVTLNASGNVVFTPTADYNGTATFTYWVKDPDGLESNAATVTLNVAPVNDAPYAQGEVVSGASEDAVFHIDKGTLLANDGDVEDPNSALSLAWVGNATHGTVSLDGSGNVVFTPAPDFNGTATFDYQVRDSAGAVSPTVTAQIPVAAVNDNPVAADESFNMYTNTATSPSVTNIGFNQLLANDTDIDNPHSDLTVSAVRHASNGTATIVGGQVQFTPTQDFNGTASFEYQVSDQHGGTAWATAFVSVAPPPNLYPCINVTYVNFYPTGSTPAGAWDIGDVRWSIADDGNTGLVSVTYLSGSYHVFGDPGGPVSSLPWNEFPITQTSWHVDVPRAYPVDSFTTTWRVVDDRGLANIWHFNYTVGSGYQSTMDFSGYAPPVVLALDGGTPHYIETTQSNVRFDLNGDGVADRVAWAAPGSGVLGIDLNGDHRITNASEFTFTQYVPGAKTDLEGLRAFDTNHNGVLDAGDAQWGQFGVWEDKNRDGQTQEGEYQSLDQLGIASINLTSDKDTHAPVQVPSSQGEGHLSGVAVMGESSFTRKDGSTGVVHDAMFAFDTERELAEVRRMALQFNQFCNTALSDHAPLGFVPIAADDHAMALPWVDGGESNQHPGAGHGDFFA